MSEAISLNNPGRIRKTEEWRGMTAEQDHPELATFAASVYGLRAIMVRLMLCWNEHPQPTIEGVLMHWARPALTGLGSELERVRESGSEEDVARAEQAVDVLFNQVVALADETEKVCGVEHGRIIPLGMGWLRELTKAVVIFENDGEQPYNNNVINDAFLMARGQMDLPLG